MLGRHILWTKSPAHMVPMSTKSMFRICTQNTHSVDISFQPLCLLRAWVYAQKSWIGSENPVDRHHSTHGFGGQKFLHSDLILKMCILWVQTSIRGKEVCNLWILPLPYEQHHWSETGKTVAPEALYLSCDHKLCGHNPHQGVRKCMALEISHLPHERNVWA